MNVIRRLTEAFHAWRRQLYRARIMSAFEGGQLAIGLHLDLLAHPWIGLRRQYEPDRAFRKRLLDDLTARWIRS